MRHPSCLYAALPPPLPMSRFHLPPQLPTHHRQREPKSLILTHVPWSKPLITFEVQSIRPLLLQLLLSEILEVSPYYRLLLWDLPKNTRWRPLGCNKCGGYPV
ncbi:hypothetical protein KFK09_016257 [Dendrobium nobile]|uniref:Uncharacterized protein n=1 Tax=Dendrobium nobile TaxID=94219 RepID=A0A8T3AXS6_DENNO|nr:hypothetical protein KFK09_016257 [Dendrobium nobile]